MEPKSPKLLEKVRNACRVRHCSIRTEEAYVDWIKRFILFHNKTHPLEMGVPEINDFLTHLAGWVACSSLLEHVQTRLNMPPVRGRHPGFARHEGLAGGPGSLSLSLSEDSEIHRLHDD